MRGRDRGRLLGAVLFGLLALGSAVLLVNLAFEKSYHHVVVEVRQADDRVRIDVDCHRAKSVKAGAPAQRVDLGWLPPGEPISISDYNDRGGAAWEYRIFVDGRRVVEMPSDAPGSTAPLADEFTVTMAESYDATGRAWGEVGCSQPLLVSPAVRDYQQLPGARPGSAGAGKAARWSYAAPPLEPVHDAAGWVIPIWAVLGFLAAFATPTVRRFLLDPRRAGVALLAFLVFVRAVDLLLGIGFHGLLLYCQVVGVGLLLLSAVVSIWPHTGTQCQDSSSTPSPNPE